MRPTWAEVSLGNLRLNFRNIQQHVGKDIAVCAVIKADAYGHGVVPCARALEEAGATWLGVTSTEEGIRLRQAGIAARILLMTGFWRGEEDEVITHNLTPLIWEPWHIDLLAKAAAKLARAPFAIHLKIDTGMARLGASCRILPEVLQVLKNTRALQLEGIATHLKSAEILDAADVAEQLSCFQKVQDMVEKAGFEPIYSHVANTAALAARRETWKSMVRPGISLYGYNLHFACDRASRPISLPNVTPVLSWKTRVISLRDVGANQAIGYDGRYVTRVPARLATLPVGYADGLSRHLSSRGQVIIRDTYAPIVGNIAMDLTMIDVSSVPSAALGDMVTLLGSSDHCVISAWQHAELENTIPYEVLCQIGHRVRREYVD
ncbi:MAG: alanine racemase [Candidatus Sulfotelmatobacter sp.]